MPAEIARLAWDSRRQAFLHSPQLSAADLLQINRRLDFLGQVWGRQTCRYSGCVRVASGGGILHKRNDSHRPPARVTDWLPKGIFSALQFFD